MQEPRRSPRLTEKRAKELGGDQYGREYPYPQPQPPKYQQEHIDASFCIDVFIVCVGTLIMAACLV
jgi:hypothetical protein